MRHLCTIFAIVAGLSCVGTAAFAQLVPEMELKAAYIYNFAMFTEWPAESIPEGGPMTVCLRNDNALLAAVNALTVKTVNGRRLAVKPWQSPDDMSGCQIAIFDARDRDRWNAVRGRFVDTSLLTISDDSDAAPADFIITLMLDEGRLAFSVNNTAAQRVRLLMSAKLLRLAKEVR